MDSKKCSRNFKQRILDYLENRAANDSLFAAMYAKPEKNIDDCITCIYNTVKESGSFGFAREEVFSMAVHYYNEDNINIGEPIECYVVIDQPVELTAEEKEQARKDAIHQLYEDTYQEMKSKKKPRKQEVSQSPSLFD